MQAVYSARATLVVTSGLGTEGNGTGDVAIAPRLGQTYAVLATTRPVLVDVIERAALPYDLEELTRRLSVTADLDTPFISITMNDPIPSRAAATANALADVLVEMASIPPTDDAAARTILAVVEPASVPLEPSGPRVVFNTVLAAAASFVASLFFIAMTLYLRDQRPIQETAAR
jgi:capsular polysaccharide biosynthesis protein